MTDALKTYQCAGEGMCVDPRCPTHSPPEMRRLVGAEHVTTLTNTERGYLPSCSCGWKGFETDRMSNDYAYTNADDQLRDHKRRAKAGRL